MGKTFLPQLIISGIISGTFSGILRGIYEVINTHNCIQQILQTGKKLSNFVIFSLNYGCRIDLTKTYLRQSSVMDVTIQPGSSKDVKAMAEVKYNEYHHFLSDYISGPFLQGKMEIINQFSR